MRDVIKVAVVALGMDAPAVIIGVQQGNFSSGRCIHEQGRGLRKILRERPGFFIEGTRLPRGIDKRPMQLLLPAQRRAPLPVQDGVRTMAYSMLCHGLSFPFIKCVV